MTAQSIVKGNPSDREELAANLDKVIRAAVDKITNGSIVLYTGLREVREKKLWVELSAKSFSEYCASPEIGLSEQAANTYINAICEKLHDEGKIEYEAMEGIPVTKLVLVSRMKNPKAWLPKARVLSWTGLHNEMITKITGKDPEDPAVARYQGKTEDCVCPCWSVELHKKTGNGCIAKVDITKVKKALPDKSKEQKALPAPKEETKKKTRDLID